MPIHLDGVLVHALSASELSRVRTELHPLRVLPTVPPHPVQPNCEPSGHRHLGDVPLPTQRQVCVVVLLAATLGLMTIQLMQVGGGHLPQHAPKSLPQGVLALDGWANRLIVVSFCLWVFVAAWHAIRLRREHA